MLIRVIDFETTSMPDDPDGAGVCEVGYCDMTVIDGVAAVGLPRSMICDPGRPVKPEACAVHHIMDAEIAGAMKEADALIEISHPEFAEVYGGNGERVRAIDCFAAHKMDFERSFFNPLVPCEAPEPKWLCSWRVALRIYPDAPSHALQVLRYWLRMELPNPAQADPAHRAGPDAYVCAHLIKRMLESGVSIADMVRWSAGPPLFTKVGFGKHKGSLWKDLPIDYLNWIVTKSDMDGDTKANARFRLKERGEI